jgi:hypothetical protein
VVDNADDDGVADTVTDAGVTDNVFRDREEGEDGVMTEGMGSIEWCE